MLKQEAHHAAFLLADEVNLVLLHIDHARGVGEADTHKTAGVGAIGGDNLVGSETDGVEIAERDTALGEVPYYIIINNNIGVASASTLNGIVAAVDHIICEGEVGDGVIEGYA